jgi:hypothetical protein
MAKSKTSGKKLPGPFLAVAAFCERVVEETDNVLSCMRLVDTMTFTLPHDAPADVPSEEKRIPVTIQGLISFRRGGAKGKNHDLELGMESPTGKRGVMHKQTVKFGSSDSFAGANFRFTSTLLISHGGLFWMTVKLDGKEFTRVPLRVLIQRAKVKALVTAQ